jgi:hypothetical protein
MDKKQEQELIDLLGIFTYKRICEIINKSAMDFFVQMKRKKGAEFASCFVLKDVTLIDKNIVDVFVHRKFKVLSGIKFQVIYDEIILEEFSLKDYGILNKIKKFNLENENKVFYIHNNVC